MSLASGMGAGAEEFEATELPLESRSGQLGARLRARRIAHRLTLRDLADKAQCSPSLLSKVEHDKVIPSLRMLHRIARGLDISIGDLFSTHSEDDVSVYRVGERPTVRLERGGETGGVVLERLAPYGTGQTLDGYVHVLSPGSTNGGTINHAGEELGYVVSGRAELTVSGRNYVLGPGDSFYFRSELPHSYRNIGHDELRIVWVNTPPTF